MKGEILAGIEAHVGGDPRYKVVVARSEAWDGDGFSLEVPHGTHQRLPDALRAEFQELPPVEAKNIGRIHAWRLGPLRGPVA